MMMDMGLGFMILVFGVAATALSVWAAIDAGSFPDHAFEAAGTSKMLWILLPLVGLLMCGLGPIAAAIWFLAFKPRVRAALDGASGPPLPPPPTTS